MEFKELEGVKEFKEFKEGRKGRQEPDGRNDEMNLNRVEWVSSISSKTQKKNTAISYPITPHRPSSMRLAMTFPSSSKLSRKKAVST